MKRILALLLALCLCVSLSACGGTGNETHDYILSLLEKGEYDMAIHTIEGLRDGKLDAQLNNQSKPAGQETPRQDDVPAVLDQSITLAPDTNGTDWMFHMDLLNQTPSVITLNTLLIRDFMDEQELGTYGFEGADLERLSLYNLTLNPNEGIGWDDGHPVTPDFNRREYLFVFTTAQGENYRMSFMFDMRGMPNTPSAMPQQEPAGDWTFPCVLENTSDTPWKLQAMDITHLMDGASRGTTVIEGEDLERVGLGGLVLQPGEFQSYMDGHPVVPDWNGAEYRFHFVDGNNQKQTLVFHFDNLDQPDQPADYSQDSGRDLKTLRHNADFETEVYSGVYWVPAVILGESRYSNAEIHNLLGASPEEKQQKISTLYEALQLYQVGNFTPSDDNIRIFEGGINWEHHKPGYDAVRTNTGCCATDSNWLRYILDGDYEEVGYIATSQSDGSGHIFNYILQDGWYYIIDLTHYHATGPLVTAYEDGNMNSYRNSDYILGNIHKTKDIQSYVDYTQRDFNDPPALMFQYTARNCLAVDGARSQSGVQIIYEDAGKDYVNVIYDNPDDSVSFVWRESPKNLPDWSQNPDCNF